VYYRRSQNQNTQKLLPELVSVVYNSFLLVVS